MHVESDTYDHVAEAAIHVCAHHGQWTIDLVDAMFAPSVHLSRMLDPIY